jgi:hypothetical protein
MTGTMSQLWLREIDETQIPGIGQYAIKRYLKLEPDRNK